MGFAFITFYPAVMLAALYGGLRAGMLATLLSAAAADYFWMEPAGSFRIARSSRLGGYGCFCHQLHSHVLGCRKTAPEQ